MKCRICGNDNENKSYEARELMLGSKDVFNYFQCSSCECLQITGLPFNLSDYYPNHYYSFQSAITKNVIKKYFVRLRDRFAIYKRGFIGKVLYSKYPREDLQCLRYLPLAKNARLLDVGCGVGDLLYRLSELGLKELLGIDIFIDKDFEYENGLKIRKKDIYDVDGEWDIILFSHSFEHIFNPAEALLVVSRLLAHNGHCVIRVPIVPSYAWDHYGVNWVQLDAPRHIYLHSIRSIQILAEQARLHLNKLVYDSTAFQFWGSELYAKGIPLAGNPSASFFSKREISAFARQAKALNLAKQGDQAVFYLMKS